MDTKKLLKLVLDVLNDTKGVDIIDIDVSRRCNFTDHMVICTGNSNRHIDTIAEKLIVAAKHAKTPPLGVEGKEFGEWVLIDLGDVIVHVMLQKIRDFYALEKLWQGPAESENAQTAD